MLNGPVLSNANTDLIRRTPVSTFSTRSVGVHAFAKKKSSGPDRWCPNPLLNLPRQPVRRFRLCDL